MSEARGFGHRVKVRRKALNLTQRALADASGVKQPLIAAIETGKRTPSTQTREALDSILDRARPATLLYDLGHEVEETVLRHGATDVRVFGSVARGQDRPGSDVDLLVHVPDGWGIGELLDLEAELAGILTVPVDLVADQGDSVVLRQALTEAIPL